jgi:hypothetical protein
MTVAWNPVEQLETSPATGCGKRLIVFADQGFVVEAVVVRVEPKLRDLVRRAVACVCVVPQGDRRIWVPTSGEFTTPITSLGLRPA